MTEFHFAFPHNYTVEKFGELPGTGALKDPLIYFPSPQGRPEHNGEWLRVKAGSGKTWVGVFAFGLGSRTASSHVLSTPETNTICVVSKGGGYMVNAEDPDQWEKVRAYPVIEFRPVPEHQLLLFSDFTNLAAYGKNGFIWRSQRLCWDDLKITKVTSEAIEGTGFDPTNAVTHKMHFAVDRRTGVSLIPPPVAFDGDVEW